MIISMNKATEVVITISIQNGHMLMQIMFASVELIKRILKMILMLYIVAHLNHGLYLLTMIGYMKNGKILQYGIMLWT